MSYRKYGNILSVTSTSSLASRGRNDALTIIVESMGAYQWESSGTPNGDSIFAASGSGVWRKILSQGSGSTSGTPSAEITASNGLNRIGNVIGLGGVLLNSTTIDVDFWDFNLTNLNQSYNNFQLYYDSSSGALTFESPVVVLSSGNNGIYTPLIGSKEQSNGVVLGYQAGNSIVDDDLFSSIILGTQTSYLGSNSSNIVNIGYQSGYRITDSSFSVMLGYKSGYFNTGSTNSIIIGNEAGAFSKNNTKSIIIGYQAGYRSTGSLDLISDSDIIIGTSAGYNYKNSDGSNILIGPQSGYRIKKVNSCISIGRSTGTDVYSSSFSVMLGDGAGNSSYNNIYTNFLGVNTGWYSYNVTASNFIGLSAGFGVYNSIDVNYIGNNSGVDSFTNSSSIFIGTNSGRLTAKSSHSIFIGTNSGYNVTASNAIFIGNNTGNEQLKIVNGLIASNTSTNIGEFDYAILIGKYLRTGGKKNSILLGGISGSHTYVSNSRDDQFMLSPNIKNANFRNVDYVFPASQGNPGTYLFNDGAGNLTWITGSFTGSYNNVNTASFVSTSSFNSFTGSYYSDSASFDIRISNLTASGAISSVVSNQISYGNGSTISSSAALYWDSTNNRLSINAGSSPVSKLHIITSDFDKITLDDTSNSGVTQMRMKASGNSLTFGINGSTFASSGAYQASGSFLSANGRRGLKLVASDSVGNVEIYAGGSADGNLKMMISSSGAVVINSLTGSGDRMLVTNSSGSISAQPFTQLGFISTGSFSATAATTTSIDLVPTSSVVFYDYSVVSGSNMRAGTIMAIASGSVVNWNESSTADFGNTTTLVFIMNVTGSGNYNLRAINSSVAPYTVKIIKRIL